MLICQEYNVSSLEFIESIRKYRKNWTAYEKVRAKAVNPKIKTINRHKVKSTNNEGSLLSSLNRLSKYETMGSEVTISVFLL